VYFPAQSALVSRCCVSSVNKPQAGIWGESCDELLFTVHLRLSLGRLTSDPTAITARKTQYRAEFRIESPLDSTIKHQNGSFESSDWAKLIIPDKDLRCKFANGRYRGYRDTLSCPRKQVASLEIVFWSPDSG